jgi:hypothetical protein
VVTTNLLFTLLLVLLFGITSALFNSTLDDNREEIEGWRRSLQARLRASWRRLRGAGREGSGDGDAGPARFPRIGARLAGPLRIASILATTGLVYGFLSPEFGLNPESLLLFISLAAGLGIVTYLAEGGSTLIAVRRFKVASAVRLYSAALAIAVISVLFSRAVGFRPGIVYGFVASSLILTPAALSRRQSAAIVALPAVALLGASVLAGLLLGPLQRAASDGNGLLTLLDSIVAIVFVAGLETCFYSMIPISFMDGAVVYRWSRRAWALLFGTVTFLFFELIINRDASYIDAFKQTAVTTLLWLVALYGAITITTWSWFRWRRARHGGVDAEA